MQCPSSFGALVLGSGSVLGTFVFGAGGRFQVVLPARNYDVIKGVLGRVTDDSCWFLSFKSKFSFLTLP